MGWGSGPSGVKWCGKEGGGSAAEVRGCLLAAGREVSNILLGGKGWHNCYTGRLELRVSSGLSGKGKLVETSCVMWAF